MPQQLTSLQVNEVSLVDKPANAEIDPATGKKIPRAVVALFKRDEKQDEQSNQDRHPPVQKQGETMTLEQIEKQLTDQAATIEALKADNALLKSDNATLAEITKMSAKDKETFDKWPKAKQKEWLEGDEKKRKKMMEPDGDEKCSKADVEAVTKAFEETQKADRERIQKLEAEATELRKRDRLRNFTAIAKAELPHTSGTDEAKGADLMAVADALGGENTEAFKRHLGVLKAADAALAMQFTELGKWGGGTPASAMAQLEAKASEIAKRDGIRIEKAMDKAMAENPDLYRQYHNERYAVRQ